MTRSRNHPIIQWLNHPMIQRLNSGAESRQPALASRASFEICVYANGYYGKSAAEPRKSKKKESKILQNEATKPNGINKSV
jgi:hypothetical protein